MDGENIVSGVDGKPDFEAMMSRFQSNRNLLVSGTLSYVVFDVIKYKGKCVTMPRLRGYSPKA
ncbi:hypothetical protein PH210_06620 [Paenibacillus sp. BSR1-1]|uniref:hypothetical protein n=1 Tax=Paenibacillus sp. BSR1-1 TaxID=3020845 RepID=UPI0025AF90A7|nr:hypothetical protein [Paenibacillus sp. BSR1-1]MDN3015880.1 hypothetical protein [Paenibacillus sp. BSR1-1]